MLSKCVMRRMWGSQTPLRQFKGIPYEILTKVGELSGADLTPAAGQLGSSRVCALYWAAAIATVPAHC